MDSDSWIIVVLCALASFFLEMTTIAFSPILLIVKEDLHLTYTQSGMFTTAFFIGYTVGQIPWGYITDRLGASKTIFLSVFGLGATTFLSSVATTGNTIIVTRLLSGFLGAGIFVPGVLLISEWIPTTSRGLAIGVFGAGTSIGGIAVSFSSPVIALSVGWRWSIIVLGVLGLMIAFMVLRLKGTAEKTPSSKYSVSLKTTFLRKNFWILGYDQFIRLGLTYVTSTWFPTFLSETYGENTVAASLSITLLNLIGIVANPSGGIISDRIGEKKKLV